MNPIGHLGLTVGAAFLVNQAAGRAAFSSIQGGWQPLSYVAVGLGAMLPDLVDKPLALLFLQDAATRTYGHTLLFSVALCLAGLALLLANGRTYGLALAGGSMAHLALDSMWALPHILYWPLLGWGFPRTHEDISLLEMVRWALNDPARVAGDIVGLFVLVSVVVWVVAEKVIKRKRRDPRRGAVVAENDAV